MDSVSYLNVDLEIEAREPITPITIDLGEDVLVCYDGTGEHGYFACYETASVSGDADSTINEFCLLVENLGPEARGVWDRAVARKFNPGYGSGAGARLESIIRAETVQRVAALNGEIVITFYPVRDAPA